MRVTRSLCPENSGLSRMMVAEQTSIDFVKIPAMRSS
ncbi:hypothetical protein NBG4_790006 [Candidatus Sulfobium mesophilum]|uniref:Uncharacterized protein n=1 Tax=Candidatus Sulfobium mesophilum TaxID=2016548 RepID=A0A2U3QKK0_9BACT|nr:hypothetical protein NBG4_790006 [Candidatus Sulfobium mesophilum]